MKQVKVAWEAEVETFVESCWIAHVVAGAVVAAVPTKSPMMRRQY